MNISESDTTQKILIIAEIGQNHTGEMKIAKKLITAAKEGGADIAKFQLFDVDSIFSPSVKWYKERKQAQLSKEQVLELANWCGKLGIEFMTSVFDPERVEWCEEIGVKRYKIGSRSIYDKRLIDAIAKTGKDIIASLGMYKGKEFPQIDTQGKVDFLYCVAKYPTLPEDLNFLEVDFNRYSGFSDHTIGIEAALVTMAKGAKIIEKHFTLDKNMHGPDHAGSMEPQELRQIVEFARKFESILYHSQEGMRKLARRSLVARDSISKGTILTKEMLVPLRPATGISPSLIDRVVGKRTARAIEKDAPLVREDIVW